MKAFCLTAWVAWMLSAVPAAGQFEGRVILVDPGHGGTDPGAVGIDGPAYPNEEDFVLDTALRLEARLKAAGATVILTRSRDAGISLTARRDLANAYDADLLISIHCNSFTSPSANGTETWWSSGGDEIDLALAQHVQTRMLEAVPLRDRGVKQAGFTVLTGNPPSALAEMLFISNPEEFALMTSGATREKEAEGFYKACADFLGVSLAAPEVLVEPLPQEVPPGGSVTFSATAEATGDGLAWQWRRDGIDLVDDERIKGAQTPNLSLTGVSAADAGFYTARITGGGVAQVTREAQLVISMPGVPAGSGTGLRAAYYNNQDLTFLQSVRVDPSIDFQWQDTAPLAGLLPDRFSVRWAGTVEPRFSQVYTFYARTSDGVRLWINDVLLIDQWADRVPAETAAAIPLVAGQKVRLVMEYYDSTGEALAELRWSSASQRKEIIPSSQLHRPPPQLTGPEEIRMVEGGTSRFSAQVLEFDRLLGATHLTDFEAFPSGSSDRVMFRRPALAGGTIGFLDLTRQETTSISNVLPEGNGSTRAVRVAFTFLSQASFPWLRLSTSNAPDLGNPVIDFTKGLRFDVWTAEPLYLGLGLRETGSTGGIGTNGGTTGTTEFVGVPNIQATRPQPSRLIHGGEWQTVDFDIPREAVQPFTGDGILASPGGRGVLEQLVLVPAGPPGTQLIYLDNFLVTEPNSLTWSLLEPMPGVSVDTLTGEVTWQPPAGASGNPGLVTLVATDAGSPPLSTAHPVRLIAAPPPEILSAAVDGGDFSLSWKSAGDMQYQVESADDPAGPWEDSGPLVTASGPVTMQSVPLPQNALRRFFRVRLILSGN